MERIYAFTDEYGNYGWDLDKSGVSSVFIISSIIVNECDLKTLRIQGEEIRKKYFQSGEMKSSGISRNHNRRKKILEELLTLPFNIFAILVYKDQLAHIKGVHYKKTFYKYLNNFCHQELRKAFKKLTIVADEIGGSEYMKSFAKYVSEREDIPNLLNEADFFFEKSHDEIIIQIADLISGTLGHQYDKSLKDSDGPNYYEMLRNKIIRIEPYPKTYKSYTLENNAFTEKYDEDIAELCLRQAIIYIENNKDNNDPEELGRVATVKYLLFKYMNDNPQTYTSTKELITQLKYMKIGPISQRVFRAKIIGKLRDSGVIIGSSHAGLKIPSKQSELFDFVNMNTTIIMPILHRLKTCRDLIKLGTSNELDIFDKDEYRSLQKFFDNNPILTSEVINDQNKINGNDN